MFGLKVSHCITGHLETFRRPVMHGKVWEGVWFIPLAPSGCANLVGVLTAKESEGRKRKGKRGLQIRRFQIDLPPTQLVDLNKDLDAVNCAFFPNE